eukprot:TRINITY_DN91215_c0_g1_i1.p1 TRINITY_DN91215_c0_g1~~TRINITY_DN91215_c0_g1_i1.p1  ORF type:complete len:193 (-),score=33.71 TRINITY_DN91215_c0_g1_i1:313-891(-)
MAEPADAAADPPPGTSEGGHAAADKDEDCAKKHPFKLWLSISALIVLLDQASKLAISSHLRYGQRVNVLPFFDLTLRHNRGAAFSMLATWGGWQQVFFLLMAIGATIIIVCSWLFSWVSHRTGAALVLMLGGAIGNFIDRLCYGYVVDFLLFYWAGWHYPAFNIADICITISMVLIGLFELCVREAEPAKQD